MQEIETAGARMHPDDGWALVRQARIQIEADLAGRSLPPAEEILSLVRAERDEQLLDPSFLPGDAAAG